jgi:serine/threonine protein kinase
MTHTPRSPTHVPSTRAPSAEVTRAGAADEVEASPAATRAGGREPVLGDRFVLLEPLGEGGHAIVWRARDRLMRTMVAVKILRALDPDWQRRFALEAEVLANLHHVNVVRAIARGRTPEGQPYVVLELVEGQSLRARLDAGGPLPWREVIEIGIQAAAALTALHSRGVIHRDVKPGNLMRTIDDGGGLVIKLIDFGVARLNSDWDELPGATPATPRRQTDAGMAIGTPAYMPMEAGLVPPDERFDVYSLGVTLYELCTGVQPGIEPVRPLGEVNPVCDAPADLAVVLAAALALEPGDRTQTAAELGRALAAVRAAHPEHRPSSLFDGRYERLAVMGTGARGEVFHAHHRGSGHEVALKLLRSAHPDDAHRFRREAQLLAMLDHPCIPRFYDYVQVAETPYISMARAAGRAGREILPAHRCEPAELRRGRARRPATRRGPRARACAGHPAPRCQREQRADRPAAQPAGDAAGLRLRRVDRAILQRRRGSPISDPARVPRGDPGRGHRDAALGGPRGPRRAGLHRQERRVLAGPAAVSPAHRDDADDQGPGRAGVPPRVRAGVSRRPRVRHLERPEPGPEGASERGRARRAPRGRAGRG